MKKRILALVLCLNLVFGGLCAAFPISAAAEGTAVSSAAVQADAAALSGGSESTAESAPDAAAAASAVPQETPAETYSAPASVSSDAPAVVTSENPYSGMTVDALVEAGNTLAAQALGLAEMDEGAVVQLQAQAQSLQDAIAAHTQEERTQLAATTEQMKNLLAAVQDMLDSIAASANGTLDEMNQSGEENSWRYLNGEKADDLIVMDASALATYNAALIPGGGETYNGTTGAASWESTSAGIRVRSTGRPSKMQASILR